MVKEPIAVSFWDKERDCEYIFNTSGPFWHVYTDGHSSDMIFTCKEDMVMAMNIMGVCSTYFPDVGIYTFVLMNNHVHNIMSGSRERCGQFFEMVKGKLSRCFARNGKVVNLKDFNCQMIEITSLQSLRNEIAYVNRNGFVAISSCTPFSYPWGAGACFFNPFLGRLPSVRFDDLTIREKRHISHSSSLDFASNSLMVHDGVILPSSFCRIKEAEALFRNAHHYFQHLSRRFEAYSEIASRLHEKVFITDEEMYSAVCAICQKSYNVKHPGHLSAEKRVELARRMKFEYNASNRQVRNILKLDKTIVDELFPD